MASLDRNLRRELENAVKKARRVAEAGARQSIEQLAVHHHEPWGSVTPEQRKLRNRLRAHGRQLGDKRDEKKGTQSIERLVGECAYEHWHRLLFARFLAENELLVEPDSGMPLSLDECRELAREQNVDWLGLASDFAQRMLPQIFRAGDPVLEVTLPPEARQELEETLEAQPTTVFTADDSLGWVYQFWQAEQKDAVNSSEDKIGADELPAVTQLFTEDYMVLFLLHNTIGAWWAGSVFAAKPDLASSAASEDECCAACAVEGIEWSYLRFAREGDAWRPAAGTFPGWPTAAKDLKVLDPCMGSGHFLAFALPMLVALRQAEEKLSVAEAVDAVLRDNLFGLELDPRCTQIAAFNVALTAWRLSGYRPLPALNLACAGLAVNAPLAAWTALAEGDALAENAMKQLYELFRQAPTLGSLLDPTRIGGELFVANFDKIRGLLSSALASEQSEEVELAVIAHGIARATSLLADRYTLVATNVPYLARRKQSAELQEFTDAHYDVGRGDLAAVFVERCSRFCSTGGTLAAVVPLNLMSLSSYERMRRSLLTSRTFLHAAKLGSGATATASWDVLRALIIVTNTKPHGDHEITGLETDAPSPSGREDCLRRGRVARTMRSHQLSNPDARIAFAVNSDAIPLSYYVTSSWGISPADLFRFGQRFWEHATIEHPWIRWQSSVSSTREFGGREWVLRWDATLRAAVATTSAVIRGESDWGKRGVVVVSTRGLPCTIYDGDAYDANVAVLCPKDPQHVAALWAYCTSAEYAEEVRKLDSALKVTSATLVKVPFDLEKWESIAGSQGLSELPKPHSNDPTQWVFSGGARGKAAFQVGVATVVGFCWPEHVMELAERADEDGIVCIPALRGELSAADRVQQVLLAQMERGATLAQGLADAGCAGESLENWLRERFAEQHCDVFHQRPFVWQVWDGLKDGFSALVNYHKLAAPNGEGRRTLEKLVYTYLGDWLDRQRADQKAGVEGADGRVAAAEHLKRELEKILEGEPPYEIFVRWKPLHQQPVGWDPDIDDGVRVNIRPFMTARPLNARGKNACILRAAPKIKWGKDRGKEPTRERAEYPWFWSWDGQTEDFMGGSEFDGNRWNDLHYTRAAKLAARERAKAGGKS